MAIDVDDDSCFPDAAVDREGRPHRGLKATGGLAGGCRETVQLTRANTYHRSAVRERDGVRYEVHLYAFYFAKDQWAPGPGIELGHRHDLECVLVWVRDGRLTHASFSRHGGFDTVPREKLHFDPEHPDRVKAVYHKDGALTHCFRPATPGERAENPLDRWLTPALVSWETMAGEGEAATNGRLREVFETHDFGKAVCPFNERNFGRTLAKNPPPGFPW